LGAGVVSRTRRSPTALLVFLDLGRLFEDLIPPADGFEVFVEDGASVLSARDDRVSGIRWNARGLVLSFLPQIVLRLPCLV
jgi:hypothetical protein